MSEGYLYLASPYSHPDPLVRQERFIKACHAAGRLMKQGHSAFAPISHSHPVAEVMGERATDHAFWMAVDLPILARASKLVILTLPGWEDSKGIAEETNFAKANGIPIEYLSEDGTVRRVGIVAPITGRLPSDARARKSLPVATGVIDYFPDALLAVAELSRQGNDQHNPGQPLHWDRTKSTDEADALMRHFIDRGTWDADGLRHSAKVAWRALALLQKEIEAG